MFTTHQNHAVQSHTTLLLLTAIVLGLVSSTLFGATRNGEQAVPPALLPAGADEAAVPMTGADADSFAADAWEAIAEQHAGHWNEAAAIWRRAAVPQVSELWRHLSVGVAELNLGNLEFADEQLAIAREFDRENPVVRYFIGRLRIKQAAMAQRSADAVPLTGTRLVDGAAADDAPAEPSQSCPGGKSAARLELEAINELETAVTYASRLDLRATLADVRWVVPVPYPISEPAASPTVGELLGSLGADNFAGKSHGLLANLYLNRRQPDQVEYHVDEANSLGIAVPDAYRGAGRLFEELGQSADAFRVYLKAMRQGDGIVAPGAKAVKNLRNVFGELF